MNWRALSWSAFLAALVGLPAATAHACLWDRDTLAMEAAGLPDVPRVATGRFARNPRAYYEMRLERVARAEADAWHARRTAYMAERLARGEHPGTHESFWADWEDGSPPSSPGHASSLFWWGVPAVIALLLVALLFVQRRFRRAERRSS